LTTKEIDEMTPYEVILVIDVYKTKAEHRTEEEVNLNIINAYYTEIMRRQDRSKKLPPLSKFLIDRNKKELTDEQKAQHMLNVARALNCVFGGTEIVNEGGESIV
jgi:hypothetical protein